VLESSARWVRPAPKAFKAHVEALGPNATALVNTATALAEAGVKTVPDVLVNGASDGRLDGFVASLSKPNGKLVLPGTTAHTT